jgi:glycogen operon protein
LQAREWVVVIDTDKPRFVEEEIIYTQDKPIPVTARSVMVLRRR